MTSHKSIGEVRSYKDVGIDIKKIKGVQNEIGKSISNTFEFLKVGKVISGYGHYAGLIDIGGKVICMHTDGVGSKILIAQQMGKYDTIGIDCMAMNINDILCVGSKPLGYLSYIALQQSNEKLIKDITKGLVAGAKLSDVAIIGGETAILPDIITGIKQAYNFDLAGMAVGILNKKEDAILGNKIKNGDTIIGIESSGLHSNGYTLARKILLGKYELKDKPEFISGKVLGNELLKPTKIYAKTMQKIFEIIGNKIHGLAHITGGAYTKLRRLNSKFNYILDELPPIKGIFKQIMIDGEIDILEMYRTFNMGIGFCIITAQQNIKDIMTVIEEDGSKCKIIGNIRSQGTGDTFIKIKDKNLKL